MSRSLIVAGALAAALVGVAAFAQDAQARTYKVLHAFCPNGDCIAGSQPGDLMLGDKGVLFGVTGAGGANGGGTVYVLKPNKNGGYSKKTLYDFCPLMGCPDGSRPLGALISDAAGNLFGTTEQGGERGGGTVFALLYDAAAKTYTHKVLYSFCAQMSCVDGGLPATRLTMDPAGTLFGVTASSVNAGDGVIFKLAPNKNKTRWTYTALHSFAANTFPHSALLLDAGGNLFGTSSGDGANAAGTAFELVLNKSTGAYAFRVLYSFCASGGDCTDGSFPQGGDTPMIMLADGSLIGVTSGGGAFVEEGGTVFKLTPPAKNANTRAKWTQTLLASFCGKGDDDCTDGRSPQETPVMDGKGRLFGTAGKGPNASGLLYQLVPKSNGSYVRRTLYSFCSEVDCTDGKEPRGLVMDGAGNLFGITSQGGSIENAGVVFELVND